MIELRYYQRNALEAVWNYFLTGNRGNPVVALPTGTGKSLIPAFFIHGIMQQFTNQRFLLLTHVKELIDQNLKKLLEVWPNAPVGVHSAGLKQRDTALPIIYGGIQSAIKNPVAFGHRDIIFVDECHLISMDEASQYITFISAMKLINPNVKIIGLTATPFRMGQGYITDGGLFTEIVYDDTTLERFNQLLREGFLAPLVPQATRTQLDVSTVGINKGEFVASQLQAAVDVSEVTMRALTELVNAGHNRRSWLIFASGIEHAEHIAGMLGTFGIDCAAVHSKKPSEYNDAAIKAFKSGELRAIANYGKLTTGFDHPHIDLIGMLRPTMSIPLWVQMLGRGTRPAEGKQNCLVMDFAKNTPRLGPINDPMIPKKKGEGTGDAPIKLCDNCGAYNHAAARICCQCGAEFEFQIKITSKAGTQELIKEDQIPIVETFEVTFVSYGQKQKMQNKVPIGPPYLICTYHCGTQMFREFVFFEHTGFAKKRAHDWWKQRHPGTPPMTTAEAALQISHLRKPKRIRVHVNKKPYPEVVGVEW